MLKLSASLIAQLKHLADQGAKFEAASSSLEAETERCKGVYIDISGGAYSTAVQSFRKSLRNLVLQDFNVCIGVSQNYLQRVVEQHLSEAARAAQKDLDVGKLEQARVSCFYKSPECPTVLGPTVLFPDEFGVEIDVPIADVVYQIVAAFDLLYDGVAVQCNGSQRAFICLDDAGEADVRRKISKAANKYISANVPLAIPVNSNVNALGAVLNGIVLINALSIVGRVEPPIAFKSYFPRNVHTGDIAAYQMPSDCDVELCLYEDALLGTMKSKLSELGPQLSKPHFRMGVDVGSRLHFDGGDTISLTLSWMANYEDTFDYGIGQVDWNVDIPGNTRIACRFWAANTLDGVAVYVTCTPIDRPKYVCCFKLHPEYVDFVGNLIDWVSGAVTDAINVAVATNDFGEQEFKVAEIKGVKFKGVRVASSFLGLALEFR